MNLSDLSKRDWHRATVAGALSGGLLGGALGWTLSATVPWLAALLGFANGAAFFALFLILIGSVNDKLNNVLRRVNESEEELQALINVRPMLDGGGYVSFGGWAVEGRLAERIAQLLMSRQPRLVVECGSGSSTLLIASCLEKLGGSRQVISLDHDPKYAEVTRNLVKQHALSDWAEVLTAPLESWQRDGEELSWYGLNLDALPDQKIDVLVVDGPPGVSGPMARYPAIPILKPHLSDECVIMLDDGDRPDEREAAARRWADELDCELEYADTTRGAWILYRERTNEPHDGQEAISSNEPVTT